MAAQLVRRLLILGAPGSGKGTLANRIVKTYGMPYVVVGDLLRRNVQERSEDSKTITDHLNKGILLPDDLVLKLLIEELEKVREQGFLLEGYPRTLNQAELLYRQTKIDQVLALNVPNDEILNRLKYRWVHLASGRVYNLQWSPPKVPGHDDVTGEPLSQREDDRSTVIRHRLETFNKNIYPIKEFYRKVGILKEYSGQDSDQIWSEMKRDLDRQFQRSTA